MKRETKHKEFLRELFEQVSQLKKMKASETHKLSINANYGHYEIKISANSKHGHKGLHRPIEINGEIHHLFVSPGELRANPSQEQIRANLKDTVIARGLKLHFEDPVGDGEHVSHNGNSNGMEAREFINLAGERGEKLIWDARHDDHMLLEAYHIIQQDILKALRQHKRKALEYVS